MTANGNPEPSDGPHPYFLAIEEVFLELRGSPLQLSPKDWQIARAWHEDGIPLQLVEDTVRRIFDRRRAKAEAEGRDEDDKVWSLGHFRRPVAAAWKRLQKLQAPAAAGDEEPLDLAARLERLAASLPHGLAGSAEAAAAIRALEGDAEGIERRLARIDRELLAAGGASLPAAERDAIERELAASRRTLAARLPADELERAGDRLREEILRRRLQLPLLSLFSPEAAGPDEA